ncbi:MAG: hypothetical protein RJA98_1321 [Pseudomonadota bacterium]|jgi:predicted ferric reductase
MHKIQRFWWVFMLGLSAVWAATDPAVRAAAPSNFFGWRDILMQVSGALGIGVMSVAMVLATRPVTFEPWLGGLDKMYRLHKWLGISGLVLAISHWLISNLPKWLGGLGLLTRPPRGPRPALPEGIQGVFLSQRGLAEGMGEWAFYAAALLMVLALIKRFPYRWFFKTHHLIAVAYLALVYHSVILLKFDDWSGVLSPMMAVLMGAGSVAAVMVLLGRTSRQRQLVGEVAAVRRHEALRVLEVDITFQGRWPGHQAGQFAFVTLDDAEGAHPYTISSAWADNGQLTFIIKALGDYTRTLADTLKPGDMVKVEGPYGQFTFQGTARRQIWVGAGIGITPFVARMKTLARTPDGKTIDLFHPTAVLDEHAISLMTHDAVEAGVQLHVLWTERDGRLDAARMAQQVPDWREADVWFCGPTAFGETLKRDFAAMGLAEARFHQELFEMR